MPLLHSVTTADPLNSPVINVLYHAMEQRSQRPRRLVPSLLLKGTILVVVVVVMAMVVKVVMGVTVPILGANGD
jgi:hypothetical protein